MRAVLHLTLTDRAGAVVAERRAANTVLQSGAALLAALFSGGGTGITHMGVGTSDLDPSGTDVAALSNGAPDGSGALQGETVAALAAEAFTVEPQAEHRRVRVRVRATLADADGVGAVREAALLSRPPGGGPDVLYNRVTFAPIDKGADHELTLFWEVDFPFGDLHWLS